MYLKKGKFLPQMTYVVHTARWRYVEIDGTLVAGEGAKCSERGRVIASAIKEERPNRMASFIASLGPLCAASLHCKLGHDECLDCSMISEV